MSGKPARSYLVGFTVATVVLVIVSVFSAGYYFSSSSSLLAKDQEILNLKVALLNQTRTELGLELNLLQLDSNITALDQRIAGLAQNLSVSDAEVTFLTGQVARLQNQSAFLSLELSAVEGAAGNLTVHSYFVNQNVTVAPSTTVQLTSQSPGEAGTLVFTSDQGCRGPGGKVQSSSPSFAYVVLLDSTSAGTVRSSYQKVSATSFSFSLQNVGPSMVSCAFSLFYVDH